MTDETILRHEALRDIDTGDAFDLEFVTCDRARGTGGLIKKVHGWVKVKGDPADVRLPGKQLSKSQLNSLRKATGIKAFNIYNPDAPRQIIKVHYRLMQFFNGKRIID